MEHTHKTYKTYKWMDKTFAEIDECNPNDPERKEKMLKDYEEKGWTERDVWSLDHTLAVWILPRLTYFRDCASGCPGGFAKTDGNGKSTKRQFAAGCKKWRRVLDEMVDGFTIIASDRYFLTKSEDEKKIEKALDNFREYYRCLWC
jgi:hypothetical protein